MVLPALERIEGFAEGEIANQIKGGEVEPAHHVDGWWRTVCGCGGGGFCGGGFGGERGGFLGEFGDEEVEVDGLEGFLFGEGRFGEGVGEGAADAGVVGVV